MSTKNNFKHKIIWVFAFIFAALALAIFVIPPMINLNFLKPNIENIIMSQTGMRAKINGDVNFSLAGRATIIAHDITIPNGTVSSCKFTIPFFDIFDLKNARISENISVNGANIKIEKLIPFIPKDKLSLHNSTIKFLNKEYDVIEAEFSQTNINALVRTDQHKYEIKSHNNVFTVKNKNNDLNLSGELFDDGTATAHIEIVAQDVNRWFEFEKPRITGHFPVVSDLFWDGEYGVKFTNLSANGITGSVDLDDSGYKTIKLRSNTADYDLTFFLTNPDVLQNASFDMDFYGELKFGDKKLKHVKIKTIGSVQEIEIDTIIADDLQIHGGKIDGNGAHNLYVSLPENGINTTCLFNGTPNDWRCDSFSYGNTINGKLHVNKTGFDAEFVSVEPINNFETIVNAVSRFGANGTIKFECPDMGGEIKVENGKYAVLYNHLTNKTLHFAKKDLPFMPESMKYETGNFVWKKDSMMFMPDSKLWQLTIAGDFFEISGDNFKRWFPNLDLQSLRDLPYTVSGNYKNGNISNLKLELGNQTFVGTANTKAITLKTDTFDMDYFMNKEYKDNFEELSFLGPLPITIPFDLGVNIALSAGTMIYNKQNYKNFIYSLHDDTQTFSFSDSSRGNLLATIKKHNIKYAINIQLNKFVFDEQLLPKTMPLNLSDTTVTAEIKLNTSGKIAHDVINNLHGTFDASFEGGKLYGFGFDEFYASAKMLTLLNSEYFLNSALTSGISAIKKMHIVGTYESGNIKTLYPLTLSMRHVDATGNLSIENGEMQSELQMTLRGTSPSPETIDITIYQNKPREFSLSEIMMHFDYEYMKSFTESHDRF